MLFGLCIKNSCKIIISFQFSNKNIQWNIFISEINEYVNIFNTFNCGIELLKLTCSLVLQTSTEGFFCTVFWVHFKASDIFFWTKQTNYRKVTIFSLTGYSELAPPVWLIAGWCYLQLELNPPKVFCFVWIVNIVRHFVFARCG